MTQSQPLAIQYPIASETSGQKKKDKATASNMPSSWIATKFRQLAQPAVAGPLLLACLCAALAYKNRNKKWGWRKEAPRPPRQVLQRSMSIAKLHGGDLALQRMNDLREARKDETNLEDATKSFRSLLSKELYSFSELQRLAAKLEMSGKEDEAIAMLQKALEKAEKKGKAHEAYELQMLQVEMLIYKGEFQRALECKCLNEEQISDARRPLYKAVISVINDDKESAKKFYKEFEEIRSHFHAKDAEGEGSPLYGVHDFESFERIVNNLKKEIDAVFTRAKKHANEQKIL